MAKKLKIEKSGKRERWKLLRYTDDVIDKNMIAGPHIEMFGNGEINIDGCLGVIEYRDTYLKLKLQKGSLLICGNDFDIAYFENRLITVRGKILSIEFSI